LSPKAVIALAGPADSARIVREFRRVDAAAAILGGPAMARQSFLDAAGSSAEGVRFSMPDMEREGLSDYAATSGYDAVILTAAAIRRAGLNRAKIRDAVAELGMWDAMNRSTAVPRLGTIRNGRRK
jgi:ABC-type branched-subunit amino acid transport system substrate-binding protein